MVSPLKPREIAAFLQSNQLLVRGVYEDGHVSPATKRTGRLVLEPPDGIEFIGDGKVKILMKEYPEENIVAFGEHLGKKANIPAKGDLFTIDEESEDLDGEKSERFHHIVSKLLFVSKRETIVTPYTSLRTYSNPVNHVTHSKIIICHSKATIAYLLILKPKIRPTNVHRRF